MNSADKQRAIDFLQENQTPAIESLIEGLTEGTINISRVVQEIQDETVTGTRLLDIVLEAVNSSKAKSILKKISS